MRKPRFYNARMDLIDIGANLTHDSFDRAAINYERDCPATRRSARGPSDSQSLWMCAQCN